MKRSDVLHEITNLKGDSAHQWVVDTYNSISPRPRGYKLQMKDPWCAATVSAVLHKLGYDDIAECSCPVMVQKAKQDGIWVENDAYVPKPADIIMYDWQDDGKGDNMGNPDHVGIVVKVDPEKKKITVREGNKSGTVGNRTLDIDGKYIRGYIVPRYEAENDVVEDEPNNSTTSTDNTEKTPYTKGNTYTINVASALNVRKGAGTKYGLVGYSNLTADAKKHALKQTGALKSGTRVTCLDTKKVGNEVWMQIPSGWICAKSGNKTYVR